MKIILYAVISFSFLLAMANFFYGSYMKYNDFYYHRMEEYKSATEYIKSICVNHTLVTLLNASKQCHDREHIANKDPKEAAVQDTLQTFNFCEPFGSCADIFRSVTKVIDPFKLTIILFCVIFLLTLFGGIHIAQTETVKRLKQDELPTFVEHNHSTKNTIISPSNNSNTDNIKLGSSAASALSLSSLFTNFKHGTSYAFNSIASFGILAYSKIHERITNPHKKKRE